MLVIVEKKLVDVCDVNQFFFIFFVALPCGQGDSLEKFTLFLRQPQPVEQGRQTRKGCIYFLSVGHWAGRLVGKIF